LGILILHMASDVSGNNIHKGLEAFGFQPFMNIVIGPYVLVYAVKQRLFFCT
jgi:hypothetical protein